MKQMDGRLERDWKHVIAIIFEAFIFALLLISIIAVFTFLGE